MPSSQPRTEAAQALMPEESSAPYADFLRAIASPIRLGMLQYLIVEGTATATACGAVVGVSATSASYHLRLLARYGIVEEDPSEDRRERPWRLLAPRQVKMPTGADVEQSAAVAQFLSAADRRDHAVASEYESEMSDVPEEWRNDIRMQRILRLSLDQFLRLQRDLRAALEPYEEKVAQPGSGSPDERIVYMSIRVVPWVRAESTRRQQRGEQATNSSAPSVPEHNGAAQHANPAPVRRIDNNQ